MARKPLQRKKELISNSSFLDIEIPKTNWIKVSLAHSRNLEFRDEADILKSSDDYSIVIDVSEKINSEDKNLSVKIRDACKLSFSPYEWRTKSYRFYTTERTGDNEEKKNILSTIFKILKEYEVENEKDFNLSKKIYGKDVIENFSYEDSEILIKLHQPTKKFVILAKGFLGSQQYAMFRGLSEYTSNLVSPQDISPQNENSYLLSSDFFKEEMGNKKLDKKTYFVVNENSYIKLKNYLEETKDKHIQFLKEQQNITKSIDLSKLNIEEDNIFDLKIKFNEQEQCFSFYGKGYFDTSSFYGTTQRSLLGLWALNFIYSDQEIFPGEEKDGYYNNEVIIQDKNKIILEKTIGGSKKDKDIRIPASEWKKIERIKENYQKEMEFWSRKTKDIKITHCDFSSLDIFSRFPAIYIDRKGDCFFAFSSRRMGKFKSLSAEPLNAGNDLLDIDDVDIYKIEDGEPTLEKKKQRNVSFSQTIKTIPISFKEANDFLSNHPFSDKIKKGSVNLNSIIHDGSRNQNMLTDEERNSIFNTVLLMAEMASNTKDTPIVKTKKIKI